MANSKRITSHRFAGIFFKPNVTHKNDINREAEFPYLDFKKIFESMHNVNF